MTAYSRTNCASRKIDLLQNEDEFEILTLFHVAMQVSVESLKAANGIVVGDALDAGDIITIPAPSPYK